MKLLLIGHSVEDHPDINNYNLTKPGGVYYSASALLSASKGNSDIYLCTAIEEKNYHLFEPVYKKVNTGYSEKKDQIPKVRLTIDEKNERGESYSIIPDNLNLNFQNIEEFDGILVNMISGYDVTLQQMKELRKKFACIIYLDVHTLARGIKKEKDGYAREFRKIPDFGQWAAQVDIIQTNQTEAQVISGYIDEENAAESILKKEGQILIVTKDKLGAVCYIFESGKINKFSVPGISVAENNKIGCGDVFGAVFFYTYIIKRSITEALEKANHAAAMTVAGKTIN